MPDARPGGRIEYRVEGPNGSRTKENRMQTKFRLAALAAGALALTGAAQASAASGYETAKFKVSVEGKQVHTQANSHEPMGKCDARNYSSGREVVAFTTPKPVAVTFIKTPDTRTPVIAYGKRKLGMNTRARVNRSWTSRITPPDPSQGCGDNGGGGGEPTPPDCGRRTASPWKMRMEWVRPGWTGLEADRIDRSLYANCPGGAFPELLEERTGGFPIAAELPNSELFDRKIGKLITIARGTRDYVLHEYEETTTVRWEITLRRMRG